MNPLIQICMGLLGTLGFNLLFNIRGKKLVFATLGGLISWSVFLVLEPLLQGEATRYLIATAAITAYGEVLARKMKTPTTTFLVPSLIPLVPGSALYYTMNYALKKQWTEFVHQAFYTLQLAVSLAVGIIAVTTVVRLTTILISKAKKKERNHLYHHSIR